MITNYDRFWNYGKTFKDFKTALMIYEILNDDTNIIEYFDDKYERQVVWSKEM
jgi:hypothetical protein